MTKASTQLAFTIMTLKLTLKFSQVLLMIKEIEIIRIDLKLKIATIQNPMEATRTLIMIITMTGYLKNPNHLINKMKNLT